MHLLRAIPSTADPCRAVGRDEDSFKRDLRELRELGLTESLAVGDRLSPRGAALLAAMRRRGSPGRGRGK